MSLQRAPLCFRFYPILQSSQPSQTRWCAGSAMGSTPCDVALTVRRRAEYDCRRLRRLPAQSTTGATNGVFVAKARGSRWSRGGHRWQGWLPFQGLVRNGTVKVGATGEASIVSADRTLSDLTAEMTWIGALWCTLVLRSWHLNCPLDLWNSLLKQWQVPWILQWSEQVLAVWEKFHNRRYKRVCCRVVTSRLHKTQQLEPPITSNMRNLGPGKITCSGNFKRVQNRFCFFFCSGFGIFVGFFHGTICLVFATVWN